MNKNEPKGFVQELEDIDLGAAIVWVVENGVLLLGAILLYSKTADLMTAFAPSQLFGYSGVEPFYGAACALLVEGVFFAMKFTLNRTHNSLAWLWNIVMIAATFIISAFAQTIDSFVVQKTLAEQPETTRIAVQWLVPMIPSLVVALILGKSIFNTVPHNAFKKRQPVSDDSQPAAVGHLPVSPGSIDTGKLTQPVSEPVSPPVSEAKLEPVNPTNGRRK